MTRSSRSFRLPEYKSQIDYLFWLLIFFFTDTGGIITSLGLNIRIANLFSFVGIFVVFLLASNGKGLGIVLRDRLFKKLLTILFFWFILYYILWFLVFNDDYSVISLKSRLIKARFYYLNWLLCIPTYYFILHRGTVLFLKLFLKTSILVTTLLLITQFLGIDIVSVNTFSRGYVDVDRVSLAGSDFLQLGLYFFATLLIIPVYYYSQFRKLLIYGAIAVLMIYVLSLTRRYYFYMILSLVLGDLLSRYLFNKTIFSKGKYLIIGFVGYLILSISLPSYTDAIQKGVMTVFESDKNTYGTTKKRMELSGQIATVKLFQDNFLLGTGYMNEWYSTNKDNVKTEYGIEGADYIFLSTTAMYGVLGLVLFLPFYYLFYKTLFKTLKRIKRQKHIIMNNKSLVAPFIIFISLSLFFLTHLLSYPNWFHFIGPAYGTKELYLYVGIMFGVMARLNSLISINQIHEENVK